MTLDQFFRNSKDLPSLPTIFYELEKEIDHPRSTPESIGGILLKDQSLVSRLLALSNSAFYGFSRRVETVPNAIQLLGLKQVRDLVMATSVLQAFEGIDVEFLEMNQFWVHSIACGVAAAELAKEKGDANPERYFVGGLLHDVGRLALLIKLPKEMGEVLNRHRETRVHTHFLEQEVIGFDHMMVGGGLVEQWRLPIAMADMVRHHHTPEKSTASFETSLVHLADILVHALELGKSGEIQVPAFSSVAWQRIGMEISALDRVMANIEPRTEQLCQIFMNK
ncbi:MAG: HDOD domain-containing protein [Verrucomicrobiota bacterium]